MREKFKQEIVVFSRYIQYVEQKNWYFNLDFRELRGLVWKEIRFSHEILSHVCGMYDYRYVVAQREFWDDQQN